MPLPFLAMAIGAGIGSLAGVAVYATKVLLSPERSWDWKDAAAHAAGGLIGGGLFPLALCGLAAVGVPTTAAYLLAGGVAWGGLWSLAQDATSWALGRATGLGAPSKYLTATLVGLLTTALLLPAANRFVGPAGDLIRHSGTVSAYTTPFRPLAPNLAKAEGEFLAYGAVSEAATAGVRAVARAATRRAVSPTGVAVAEGLLEEDAGEETPDPSSASVRDAGPPSATPPLDVSQRQGATSALAQLGD
ncbi:MAG: hypothetical protein AB7N76_32625 [Planctomycetota bacterium]